MRFFLTILITIMIVFCVSETFADESGIFFPGAFTGVAGTPDGSAYLLAKDHRLIKIAKDNSTQEIKLPKIADAGPDDYLCDLVIYKNKVSLCGYPFSGIFELELNKPEKLNFFELTLNEKKINPLMVSKKADGWRIKDAEERVLHVALDKSINLMPEFSEIESEKYGQAIICPPPRHENDKIFYPGYVLKENEERLWTAPSPDSPRKIMSIEFLGKDKDQRYIFLVNAASGELDTKVTLYAVKENKIVASRMIPPANAPYVMRYCRLSPDGTILLLLADPNGRDGVILKRLNLETTAPAAG